MHASHIACLRQSASGLYDEITRQSLRHLAESSMQVSTRNGWIVSEGSDQWQTLLHVIAGLEFNQSVFFAGSIFSQKEIEAAAAVLPASEAPSFAFLTSGSTGTPKMVIHSGEALTQAALRLADVVPLGGRRMHHLFPPNYMAGVLNCVLLPWVTDGSVVVGRSFSFETPLQMPLLLGESQSEVAWLSPRMMRSLATVAQHQDDLRESLQRHWRLAVSATGPLDVATRNAFSNVFQIPVLNTYGTTEHLFISAETDVIQNVSCGSLLPHNEIAFGTAPDENFSKTFVMRQSGVVWVKTPFMTTLVADAKQDRGSFHGDAVPEGHFRQTGDVGRLDGGCLYVDHRTDDIVVWDGINISPRAYEDTANAINSVIETMLSLVSHNGRDLLVLFVVINDRDPTPNVIEQIGQRFRAWDLNLPAPNRILNVEELPRTHTGKINRRGGQHLFEMSDAQ